LRDVAQLSARLTSDDWQDFFRAAARAGRWWVYPPLGLSARYFPGLVPTAAVAAARRDCPLLLRRAAEQHDLTAVSWSNLRIDAFPGIEWARTPIEVLRYAKSRFAPGRAALEELTHAKDVLPQLATVPWYEQRHAMRIVRWVFTRPPRVQTIASVLAALNAGTAPERAAP
jgi:hypothetical protein